MTVENGALDMEALKSKDRLSEEDEQKIATEAIAEVDAEHKAEAKKEEGAKPEEEAAPKEEPDESTEEEKAKVAAEEKKKEEERLLSIKDEELSEEDKPKKVELLKAKEVEKATAFEEEVKAYAAESKMSVEEAKEDLGHISKIREKYKDDPKQLAKANLYIHRLYANKEAELKALKESSQVKEITAESITKAIDEGKITVKGQKTTKEGVIQAYREQEPDLTADLDDEATFKLATRALKDAIEKQQTIANGELASKAKDKRSTLLNSLPEADKPYLADIKAIVENLSDAQVMKENFALDDTIAWAKGKNFDKALKEHGEKEYKRGLEEAKILGEKTGGGGKPPVKKTVSALNPTQEKRAAEMFPDLSKEDQAKSYKEVYPEEFKKK